MHRVPRRPLLQLVRLHPDLVLTEMPANNVVYLAMNTQKPPFHNPRVRRAVNHAIRKEPLIGLVYGGLAAVAAVIVALAAFGLTRWSDAVWERDAHRQLLTPEEQAQATGSAPIEVA